MVSRENLGKAAGWITQPQTMIGNWVGQQVGGRIKNNNERVENKNQTFSTNNYKSNLDMPTYNSRYPGFDEANYKKLEQMAVNRGLTGGDMIQFMDEAYQYYYPQVLNEYGLNKRAEEINKTAAENGSAILNGNKEVSWNMKLVDLSQTFKRVKGVAYDYPDEQVIDALKTRIPDGEQLLLNYLNDGDDTILYKAGLKKTDAQVKLDEYNKRKENINKALQQNWKQLSDDGVKYLRNYNVLFQTVDEARLQGMGQGMTDDELLLNLLYISPELQQLEKEIGTLNLDHGDKAILGIEDDSKRAIRPERHETVNTVRDWLGWNGDNPATLDDLAEEIYVRENMDGQTWKNAKANWRNRGDSLAKFGYRVPRDINNLSLETELQFNDNLSQEDIDRIREKIGRNKQDVQAFNEATDREQQSYKNQIGLDPIIENYYNNQGMIESLFNNNLGGAWYKGVGEAAGNIDMLAGMVGSAINPAFGLFIMGTDTYARENQEAFDSLINAQTKQGISYEDAYNNASKGAVVVGVINTAIELGLEKFLGGFETRTANNIKKMFSKDLNKEVSEMIAKRGILEMLGQGLETQARSSLEEGLEEVFQQLVSNIAESGYDPDKQISEGLWRAFESGALNPMNLLAGGSELLTDTNQIKDAMYNSAYDAGVITRNIVDTFNPKSIVSNIKNGNINWNSGIKNETLTRVIPEKVVEGGMKLTPTERARVESTGISPANFILSEGIAGLDSQDKIAQLANIGAEGYNNVTKIFKEVIPDTEVIESKEAQKMLNIMAKVIESSDILSEEYADYLQSIKRLAQQTKFDPYTALAIKRDFDALAGHDLYNSKGQVMKDIEKETIAGWRANLNEKLNKLGDRYGVDVRKENQRVMNAITIRDGLLRAMSQNKKNNFLGLGDLGFGALLSSGNPVQAVAMIGLKKFAQNNIGNMAQKLYNLNNTPLTPLEKKGASFIKKGNNNAGNLSLSSIMNNPTTVDNTQQGVDVGANPTDTVISKNVNEMAGNQAQELYNQGDENLSLNSEQMTNENLIKDVKNMKVGEQIHIKFDDGDGEIIAKLEDGGYRTKLDSWESDYQYQIIKDGELESHIDSIAKENGIDEYEQLDKWGNVKEEQEKLGWGDEYYSDDDIISEAEQNRIRNKFKDEYGNFKAIADRIDDYAIDNGFSLKNALQNILGQGSAENFLKRYFNNEIVGDIENSGNVAIEEDIDTDEENNFSDQGWVDENIDEDALEDQGVKRYADEAYRPSITMKTDGYESSIENNNSSIITEKPTEVRSIDNEGNWLANDEGGIKIKYHPDGYLDVKLTEYPSSDEMIGFEQFKYEPIKEVELTILDEQTGKPVRSNRVNSIDELLEYLEDYFINGNTGI